MTAGKGSTAHFVWRCGLCKRESSARFEPNEKPKPYTVDANGQFAPFLTIDCRGLEFIGFDPKVCAKQGPSDTSFIYWAQGIWKCVGVESGTPFEADLEEESEWVDYDEKVYCQYVKIPDSAQLLFRRRYLSVCPRSRLNGQEHSGSQQTLCASVYTIIPKAATRRSTE